MKRFIAISVFIWGVAVFALSISTIFSQTGWTPPAGGGGGGGSFNGGTITTPLVIAPAGVNLMNFPITHSNTGSFHFGMAQLSAEGSNDYDRNPSGTYTSHVPDSRATVTTTSGSAIIRATGAAWPNCFYPGDAGRTITATGIPANTTILGVPTTTIASGSNNVALSGTFTVHATSLAAWSSNATGRAQIHCKDGTYAVIAYTGKSGNDLTTCTVVNGAGTMITGAEISSITEAILSANATASATVSAIISQKSDSPFYWGYNNPSDPNYNPLQNSFGMQDEPYYMTQGGVEQNEFYITANGVNGESGQLAGDRVFTISTALYDANNMRSVGYATMNLYPNSLVIGNPNNLNDVIIVNPNPSPLGQTSMLFQTGRWSNIDFEGYKNGESGVTNDWIRSGGEGLLGFNSDGSLGRLFAGRQKMSIFSDWDNGHDFYLYFSNDGNGLGFKFDHTAQRFNVAGTANTWLPIVTTTSTDTLTYKTLTSPAIGTSILDTNGNTLLGITATASAVDYVTLKDSAANGGAFGSSQPTIGAAGSDTDVSINIQPKGAGHVHIIPSGSNNGELRILKSSTDGDGTAALLYFVGDQGNGATFEMIGSATGSGRPTLSFGLLLGDANEGFTIYDNGTNRFRFQRDGQFLIATGGIAKGTFQAAGTATTCTGATIGTGSKSNAGFVTATTTGASTIVITFPFTAATGWAISASDNTTANLVRQTASSTTTATLSGTTVSGDVISYIAVPY